MLDFLKPSNPTVPPPGTSAFKAYLSATGNTPEQGASAYAAQQAVPPSGTSAHKAYEYYQQNGRPAPSLSELFGVDSNNPSSVSYPSSARSTSPASTAVVDYVNADLARHYGMSAATAYQEALANTSYQRSVKDMQAAGLNPAVLFGSGRAQGANSSIYPSGSSGSGGRGRSSSSDGKLFSGSAYAALQAIGGLVGIAVTGRPDGYWVGSQVTQGAMGLLDSVYSASR